jgi:hypothetical protein
MHAQTMPLRSRWLPITALCFGMCVGGCGGSGGTEGSAAAPPAPSPAAPPSAPPPAPIHIDGAAQKGPFLVGSTVLINRRDDHGISTSATILSEIEDSIGSFDFVTTDPGLVQIVATGYYFSELTGQVSNGTLTLRALYKITDRPGQKAYVNIMTHLINDRVLALLAAGNIDAASAIAKAETELVKAFRDALPVASVEGFSGLSVYNMSGAAGAGVGNTYLLALSTGFYKYAATKAEEFGTATDAELTLGSQQDFRRPRRGRRPRHAGIHPRVHDGHSPAEPRDHRGQSAPAGDRRLSGRARRARYLRLLEPLRGQFRVPMERRRAAAEADELAGHGGARRQDLSVRRRQRPCDRLSLRRLHVRCTSTASSRCVRL